MYPVVIRFGAFEITSFGVMIGVAFAVGLWLFRRELRRSGLPVATADAALWGMFGGLLGAKLAWALEFWRQAPFSSLFFARGGFSWYGGLCGGLALGILALRRCRAPLLRVLAAATPAFAIGHLLGRIGCFLVGDDYGRPSNLPWAVAFPNGLPPTTVPVHPTQLYEAVALAGLGWALLHWRASGVADRVVLGRYLAAAGLIRFAIEFIRINEPVAGPLTLAQLFAGALLIGGVALMIPTRPSPAPRAATPLPASARLRPHTEPSRRSFV